MPLREWEKVQKVLWEISLRLAVAPQGHVLCYDGRRKSAPSGRPLNEERIMDVLGVIAYHVIITNYGFWLPNDPRGSW
jgi:hypothetical protein